MVFRRGLRRVPLKTGARARIGLLVLVRRRQDRAGWSQLVVDTMTTLGPADKNEQVVEMSMIGISRGLKTVV